MSAELEPSDPLPTASVAIDELNPYYRNPRHGDVGAIAESLELLGQYRHVVVNVGTFTDRPMEIDPAGETALFFDLAHVDQPLGDAAGERSGYRGVGQIQAGQALVRLGAG